jgi:hypothetical protein
MPPVADANYTVLVEADSQGAVTNDIRTGDIGASSLISAIMPTLTLGATTTDSITFTQEKLYSLNLTAGEDVSLAASFAVATEANIYISAGAVPTPETFDQSATDPAQTSANFLLNATQSATYYVLVYGRVGAGSPESFTLTPAQLPYGPAAVSPVASVNSGEVTVTVDGSGFTPSTAVTLVSPISGVPDIAAAHVEYVNSNQLYAIFDFNNAVPGAYNVQTSEGTGGATASLAGAFTIDALATGGATTGPTSQGQLDYFLSAPTFIRAGESGTLTLTYENVGGSDIGAPLFDVTSDNGAFRIGNTAAFVDGAMDVIGINPTGPAGLLPPGASGSVLITFQQDVTGAHVPSHFQAFVLNPATKVIGVPLNRGWSPPMSRRPLGVSFIPTSNPWWARRWAVTPPPWIIWPTKWAHKEFAPTMPRFICAPSW